MRAMGVMAKHPTETIELGAERLLWMSMTEAAKHYGVPDTVIGRRLRQDEKRKSAAA
jgi:helix-turn-helix, Psq domain